jgi:hypothetical protein
MSAPESVAEGANVPGEFFMRTREEEKNMRMWRASPCLTCRRYYSNVSALVNLNGEPWPS